MKIYKYPLQMIDTQFLVLPATYQILSVQLQNGQLCLWASVDADSKDIRQKEIYIVGTGHDTPRVATQYLGTVQDGGFVWHVFIKI